MMFVKPYIVLKVSVIAIVVFSCAAVGVEGEGGIAILSLLYFPNSTSYLARSLCLSELWT
jgi:hypothetical protein